MKTSDRPIFVVISRGYFLRLFEYTGLIDRLIDQYDKDVIVLTQTAGIDELRELFSEKARVHIEPLVSVTKLPLGDKIYRAGLYRLSSFRLASKIWFKTELILNRSSTYDELFDKYQPSLVVTASTGKHDDETPPLIRNARRRSVPTLCVVWSWDNLSMSGPVATRPDRMAVWNDRMFDDAVDLQKFPQEAVTVVGVPQFDHYFSSETFTDRSEFSQRFGLDPNKKLITLATAPMRSVADHRFLVELMIRRVSVGDFGEDVELLIRPHPMEDPDFYSEYFTGGNHHFDITANQIDGLDWTPNPQDAIDLANVLYHTDVMVNIASTVTLEAAILDKAVVNVAFSLSETERFEQMVIENHYGAHFKHVFDAHASQVVASEDELVEAVNTLLSDPSLMRENRRGLALATCDRLDGSGTARVAELIAEMADN
jgi:hypothetical protein